MIDKTNLMETVLQRVAHLATGRLRGVSPRAFRMPAQPRLPPPNELPLERKFKGAPSTPYTSFSSHPAGDKWARPAVTPYRARLFLFSDPVTSDL